MILLLFYVAKVCFFSKNTNNILFLGEPLREASPRSRRAIRSISHYSPTGFRGWFRFYPSRCYRRFAALVASMLVLKSQAHHRILENSAPRASAYGERWQAVFPKKV
jgi:hypothetical protein